MSMYGTRDAAFNWAEEYRSTLVAEGCVRGEANPCLFSQPKKNIAIMVHGDDFVAVWNKHDLEHTRRTLETKYKLKTETLGTGE